MLEPHLFFFFQFIEGPHEPNYPMKLCDKVYTIAYSIPLVPDPSRCASSFRYTAILASEAEKGWRRGGHTRH